MENNDPIELQMHLRDYSNKTGDEFFQRLVTTLIDHFRKKGCTDISPFTKIFRFANDDRLFRAITSGIRNDFHQGAFISESKQGQALRYSLPVRILEAYIIDGISSRDDPVTCWVRNEENEMQSSFFLTGDSIAPPELGLRLDSELFGKQGYSVSLWFAPDRPPLATSERSSLPQNGQLLSELFNIKFFKTKSGTELQPKGMGFQGPIQTGSQFSLSYSHESLWVKFTTSGGSPTGDLSELKFSQTNFAKMQEERNPESGKPKAPLHIHIRVDPSGEVLVHLDSELLFRQKCLPRFESNTQVAQIQLLTGISGKLFSLFTFYDKTSDEYLQMCKSLPFGLQRAEHLDQLLANTDRRLQDQVLSPAIQDVTMQGFSESGFVPVRVNCQHEVTLYSPGLEGLIPLFTLLRYIEQSSLLNTMLALNNSTLCYLKVLRSKPKDEMSFQRSILNMIETLSLQIDILIQKNFLKEINRDVLDSFHLMYREMPNLACKEAMMLKVLSKWKMLQRSSKEEQERYYHQITERLTEEPFSNHQALLGTILLKQDEYQRQPSIGVSQKYFHESTSIGPIRVYKDLPPQLDMAKVKAIFSKLVEFCPIDKAVEIEIPFLGLFKDFLQRILATEKNLRLKPIIDVLRAKFAHNVIQIKETVLGILAEVFNSHSATLVEQYGQTYIDEVCRGVCQELKCYVFTPAFEAKIFGLQQEHPMKAFGVNRVRTPHGSSQKSEAAQLPTPQRQTFTPMGASVVLGMSQLQHKIRMGPASVKHSTQKTVGFDIQAVSSTPGAKKVKGLMLSEPVDEVEFSLPPHAQPALHSPPAPQSPKQRGISLQQHKHQPQTPTSPTDLKPQTPPQPDPPVLPKAPSKIHKLKGNLALDIAKIESGYTICGEDGQRMADESDDKQVLEQVDRMAEELVKWMEMQDRVAAGGLRPVGAEFGIAGVGNERSMFKRPLGGAFAESNRSAPMTSKASGRNFAFEAVRISNEKKCKLLGLSSSEHYRRILKKQTRVRDIGSNICLLKECLRCSLLDPQRAVGNDSLSEIGE